MRRARRRGPTLLRCAAAAAAALASCTPGAPAAADLDVLADVVLVPGEGTIDDGLRSWVIQHTEVTNRDYLEFLVASGYGPDDAEFLKHWRGLDGRLPSPLAPPPGREDHPVVYVSLLDAEAYAAWAGMRIPTQREWRASASYGTTGEFPFGFYRPLCANTLELGLRHTTPVGMFENGRSALGAYDLAGNVGEWTAGEDLCVIEGGSFNESARRIQVPDDLERRLGARSSVPDVGFRCVQESLPYLARRLFDDGLSSGAVARSLQGFLRRGGEPARRVLDALAAARPGERGTIQEALEPAR